MIRAVAKIIKEEIREMNFTTDHYPTINDIEGNEELVPDSLLMFMEFLVETAEPLTIYCASSKTRDGYCTDAVWGSIRY